MIDFFEPIDDKIVQFSDQANRSLLGNCINKYSVKEEFPDIHVAQLAIIGVGEDRNALGNQGCAMAPDFVRKYLYRLYKGANNVRIVDLGNVKTGHAVKDTYVVLSQIVATLLEERVLPVIIGGGQDLTYANYLAYEDLGQIINLVSVDNSFDLGKEEALLDSSSFLSHIIMHQPNFLFNYANIGYQTYFVEQDAIKLMGNLYFDAFRLGNVQADMEEVEPVVRNADVLSIDVSAIRQSDAPGNANATPNGFYGEELCRIVRYAGMSDKLSSIGFYEMNPLYDNQEQTLHLVAQAIWYFIDGYSFRKKDIPSKESDDYVRYRVAIQGDEEEVVFLKSKKSDRWWMEVPYQSSLTKYDRHHWVPCSYKDYQMACNEEVPDKWWQAYQKLT